MCISLVFLTYVYHDARFRECYGEICAESLKLIVSQQDPKVVGCCDELEGFMTVWFINYLTWQNNSLFSISCFYLA